MDLVWQGGCAAGGHVVFWEFQLGCPEQALVAVGCKARLLQAAEHLPQMDLVFLFCFAADQDVV